MRTLLPVLGLLLACGCTGAPTSNQVEARPSDTIDSGQPRYAVLTEPPDAIIDRMAADYPHDNDNFRRRWTEEESALPLDGQRAIELLEVACYADVMCLGIEYPLRVATLDYIEENINTADVAEALRWAQSSYKSGLPLESPGDEAGVLRGILVESMGIRMASYAEELLAPRTPSQHRK